jgi:hypothetical protein
MMRRLRGMLGTGITWGVGWAIVMFILGTIVGMVDPDSIDPGEEPWRIAGVVGMVGFLSGVAFAGLFSWIENRKSLRNLSVLRAAMWGAMGGAAMPLLTTMNDMVIFNTVPLGALFAASTVAIARRAALKEPGEVESLEPATRKLQA